MKILMILKIKTKVLIINKQLPNTGTGTTALAGIAILAALTVVIGVKKYSTKVK